jgi:hypothetical protein
VYPKCHTPKYLIYKVEKEMINFLWNRKKTKIRYTSLIENYEGTGLRLPDLETLVKEAGKGFRKYLCTHRKCPRSLYCQKNYFDVIHHIKADEMRIRFFLKLSRLTLSWQRQTAGNRT